MGVLIGNSPPHETETKMKATAKQRTACMANPARVGAVLAARVECDDCGRFAVANVRRLTTE